MSNCAHTPCGCPVGEGEKYCSAYCQDSGNPTEFACECGHRGCASPAAIPDAEREPSKT